MSPLLQLVKILTSLYQASKLTDESLTQELLDTLALIPEAKGDVFTQDKKIEVSIRDTIKWVLDQPKDEPVIKSNLMQRVLDFSKEAPELKSSIEYGLEDYPSEERTRQVIYQHIKEIRKARADEKFGLDFKEAIKEPFFGDPSKMTKEKWAALADMIEDQLTQKMLGDTDPSLVESVDTDDPDSFTKIIERAKEESSAEGVLKLGLQGMNRALWPDCGLRRGKFYLINALTNRGKSFGLGHVVASVGLYNKPMLRDRSRIPTVLLDSAEDALDVIIERIYKLIMVNKTGEVGDFATTPAAEIAKVIIDAFAENGWVLKINRVNPTEDNYYNITDRIRKLEMKGHEIIFYAYDYLAMADLKGMTGETKGDKLQDLYRRTRAFMVNRGIAFVTPHQLSPEAKKHLREADDESELYFAREVGGKSMTETSTKITNEVDYEFTFHVAKPGGDKAYFTWSLGKARGGEGSPMSDRFGIYDLDPTKGLVHDINGKNQCRRSFKVQLDADGNEFDDFDA
ncbi:DnaB-like replicative helicase [Vibrio phage Aphrodite1]|uniref:DNA helicase n=3 Tax=Aphroditevirus TaxID=2560092 RepID=A0A2I7QHS4_9CAUD|nr:DnaB-like replicative helicase [Vibrio phage Aphrodite1]YP_009847796.1 DnaB-like replicative helicase [Vibrio phage USC-1]AUR80942.1 DNA helicase [Vibrio phage Aphrodite1]QCW23274.1 DNA helicase [Vibrio phage 5 TSL-2019]QDH47454.1 DNA helicase [Vibrio phage USC-1]